MPTYFTGFGQMKNEEKSQAFSQAVGPLLAKAGAEPVLAGPSTVLLGDLQADDAVVVRFPGEQAITEWFESKAYQELAGLRDEGGTTTYLVVNTDS